MFIDIGQLLEKYMYTCFTFGTMNYLNNVPDVYARVTLNERKL